MLVHHALDGDGGGHRGRAEEVVAAAVPVGMVVLTGSASGLDRVADVGQRIVLGEHAQDGAPRPPGCDESGGHARDAALDGEAFFFEDIGEMGGGLMLLQRDLGELPEPHGNSGDEIFQRGGVGQGGRLALLHGLGGGGGGGQSEDGGGGHGGEAGPDTGGSRRAGEKLHLTSSIQSGFQDGFGASTNAPR